MKDIKWQPVIVEDRTPYIPTDKELIEWIKEDLEEKILRCKKCYSSFSFKNSDVELYIVKDNDNNRVIMGKVICSCGNIFDDVIIRCIEND